jgi:hypothetical protein
MEVKIRNVQILELLVQISQSWFSICELMNFNTTDGTRMIRFFSIFWIIIVLHTRMIRFFSIFWIITVLQISFSTKSNDVLSHYSMHKYSVVYFSLRLLVVLIPNMASLKRYLFKIIMLTTSSWIRLLLLVLGFLCIVRIFLFHGFICCIEIHSFTEFQLCIFLLTLTCFFLINEAMFAGITHNTM